MFNKTKRQSTSPQKESQRTNNKNKNDCCPRIRAELKASPFHPNDVLTNQPFHGPHSVGVPGRIALLFKTALVVVSIQVMIDGYTNTGSWFYFAYLTHWSLVLTVLYFGSSWYHTLVTTIKPDQDTQFSVFHKLTWALFCLAAPAEIIVTVGYWGLEWDGNLDSNNLNYRNLMVHGVLMLLLLLEGLVLNRIPVRLRHFGLLVGYLLLYLIWSLLHGVFGIGRNPNNEDNSEDDTLYTALQWKNDPVSTALVAAQFLFVLAPIAFLLVWILALWSCCPCSCSGRHRRYASTCDDEEKGASSTSHYVEMNVL